MPRRLNLSRRMLRDERGSPLVELALALPLLLLLVFGTLEFGSLLYQQQVITKGVQDAARFAARSPAIRKGGMCPPTDGSWAGVQTAARNVAVTGRPGGGTLTMSNFTASTVVVSVNCPSAAGMITPNSASGAIPVVNVIATVPARDIGFFAILNLTAFNLTAEHQEMGVGL